MIVIVSRNILSVIGVWVFKRVKIFSVKVMFVVVGIV